MEPTTIYFIPTLRFRRTQLLNDFLPGFLLLLSGIDRLSTPNAEHSDLAWLNIVAGGAAMTAIIIEWRKQTTQVHTLINRIDLFVGIVLFVEGLNRYKSWKGFQPAYLYMFIGVVTILRGLFHAKLPKLRRIILDENGFIARTSLLRRKHLPWKDISSIRIADSFIEFTTQRNQSSRLGLRRIQNRDEIITALSNHAEKKHIPVSRVSTTERT
jgi:hypothetical protein